jgi:Beta/Gamma crystallin
VKTFARWTIALAGLTLAGAATAQVTFFEHQGFRGRSFTAQRALVNFTHIGFNNRVSSIVVRGGPWEFCEHPRFSGRCVLLRPGRYGSMRAMGLNNQLSSARPARNMPPPQRR